MTPRCRGPRGVGDPEVQEAGRCRGPRGEGDRVASAL